MSNSSTTVGWEVTDLTTGYGVTTQMEYTGGSVTLNYLDVDMATMSTNTSSSVGWVEILAQVALLSSAPTIKSGNTGQIEYPVDGNYGTIATATDGNPGSKTLHTGGPGVGGLVSVIFKIGVTADESLADSRHVTVPCALPLASGDYFAFHADMASSVTITMDFEMQVCLNYG